MKVFISWSGNYSKECAETLRDWIKCTLQASKPWVSSKDIDKGSLWFSEINDQLKDTKVGIVCLTKRNKEKPWILFEAGALAKGLSANRVCTFLIDLKPTDLDNPLAQFNHTLPDQEGMKALLSTINNELGESRLDERILDQVFETYWEPFEQKFSAIVESAPHEDIDIPVRSSDEMLEEILNTTRTMDRRVRNLERYSDDPNSKDINRLNNISEYHHFISNPNYQRKVIAGMLDSGSSPAEIIKIFGEQMPFQKAVSIVNQVVADNEKDGILLSGKPLKLTPTHPDKK